MKEYLLAQKELHPTSNGKMNYCPICLKDFEKKNQGTNMNYRDVLKPLTYTKKLQIDVDKEGQEFKYIDEKWTCTRGHNVTDEDYLRAYCITPDGKRYGDNK